MNEENKNEKPEEEELDFTKPTYTFIPRGSHQWRQHSCYLVCKSCELEHAVYIGMEKLMIGLKENGDPILVDREAYKFEG